MKWVALEVLCFKIIFPIFIVLSNINAVLSRKRGECLVIFEIHNLNSNIQIVLKIQSRIANTLNIDLLPSEIFCSKYLGLHETVIFISFIL